MAMQSDEIYQAQAVRFSGWFTACFAGLAPYFRRTRPGQCRQRMLCLMVSKELAKTIVLTPF